MYGDGGGGARDQRVALRLGDRSARRRGTGQRDVVVVQVAVSWIGGSRRGESGAAAGNRETSSAIRAQRYHQLASRSSPSATRAKGGSNHIIRAPAAPYPPSGSASIAAALA
jgi:hypothetical protein